MVTNKKAVIEAVLFMSSEPVSFEKILKLLHTQKIEEVAGILKNIQEELKKEEHGIHLIETKEGWVLKVKAESMCLSLLADELALTMILKVFSPGMYSITPHLSASLNANSPSAKQGTMG